MKLVPFARIDDPSEPITEELLGEALDAITQELCEELGISEFQLRYVFLEDGRLRRRLGPVGYAHYVWRCKASKARLVKQHGSWEEAKRWGREAKALLVEKYGSVEEAREWARVERLK